MTCYQEDDLVVDVDVAAEDKKDDLVVGVVGG